MAVTQLTTVAAVKKRISLSGYTLRTDDTDTDTAANLISAVIDDASTEVYGYLGLVYSSAELEASNWTELRCRDIAVALFCERRLNDMPSSAQRAYDRAIEQLTLAQQGAFQLPDARPKKGMAPKAVNVRHQLRPLPHTVVVPGTSTKATVDAENYERHKDRGDAYVDYTI